MVTGIIGAGASGMAAALAAAIYLTSAKIAGFEELDLLSDLIKRGEKEE